MYTSPLLWEASTLTRCWFSSSWKWHCYYSTSIGKGVWSKLIIHFVKETWVQMSSLSSGLEHLVIWEPSYWAFLNSWEMSWVFLTLCFVSHLFFFPILSHITKNILNIYDIFHIPSLESIINYSINKGCVCFSSRDFFKNLKLFLFV